MSDPLALVIAMAKDWTDPVVVRDAPDRVPHVIERLIEAIDALTRDLQAERDKTEQQLREAWEEGFRLCRGYGDNHAHFAGEQKEQQWQSFKLSLTPPRLQESQPPQFAGRSDEPTSRISSTVGDEVVEERAASGNSENCYDGQTAFGEWLHTEECWASDAPFCLQSCRVHNAQRLGIPMDEDGNFLTDLTAAPPEDRPSLTAESPPAEEKCECLPWGFCFSCEHAARVRAESTPDPGLTALAARWEAKARQYEAVNAVGLTSPGFATCAAELRAHIEDTK